MKPALTMQEYLGCTFNNLEGDEQRTVAVGSHFISHASHPLRQGKIEISLPRQIQSAVEQGAQQEERNWFLRMGPYHGLERAVNAHWPVTITPRPWDAWPRRRSVNCMVSLTTAHLPLGSAMSSALVSSAGCRGRLPPTQRKRHATQDLWSKSPLARRSARSKVHRACTNPPWQQRVGTVPVHVCSPNSLQRHHVCITCMLRPLPPTLVQPIPA